MIDNGVLTMDNRIVKTVTIPNGFRNVTLTKEEFIARWLEHVSSFYTFGYNNKEAYNKIIEFANLIQNLAAEEFEQIYIKQTSQRIVCHNTLITKGAK